MNAPKTAITNIAAVCIIYRAQDPSQIFIEIKDDGHPLPLVRRQLCPIGGNWIGEEAKNDSGPFETMIREVCHEELSFDRPIRDQVEVGLIYDNASAGSNFSPTPINNIKVSGHDLRNLDHIKTLITLGAEKFGDFLNTVTKEAMTDVDPNNKREPFTTLVSYFAVGFSEQNWHMLLELQEKFGNISNESITLVTSVEEIVRTGQKTSFAHDRVLKSFFLSKGVLSAHDLPLVSGLMSTYAGETLTTYAEYLERYTVAKKPI